MTFINNFVTFGLYFFIILTQNQFCSTQEELYSGSICRLLTGNLGVCKPYPDCQWIRDEMKAGRITRSDRIRYRCSFEGLTEIVCCGDETPETPGGKPNMICNDADDICFDSNINTTPKLDIIDVTIPSTVEITTTGTDNRLVTGEGLDRQNGFTSPKPPISVTPTSRTNGQRRAEIACNNYTTYRRAPITYHILNGEEAVLGEFPHMAALGYPNEDIIEYRCGASLISERYLVTAAHCASSRVPAPVTARLGKINIESVDADDGIAIDIGIESITLHPQYGSNRNYHDIALVRLVSVIPFDENVHPACLRIDQSDPPLTESLIITGWGRIDANRDISSSKLLKTNLTTVSVAECNTFYTNERRRLPNGLNQGHFCAYDPAGLSDACQGDSGGPLQLMLPTTEMSVLVGVTSFGYSCGSKIPAVYARIAFYLDWIEKIVWP